MIAKALAKRLAVLALPEAALAEEVLQGINQSIGETRSIARGLCPVELSGGGLTGGLTELAVDTQRRAGVSCRFQHDGRVQVQDMYVALHLFQIAREAVTNAIRHAHPRNIIIRLGLTADELCLEVRDDGTGRPPDLHRTKGLGLSTMKCRAGAIGGHFAIESLVKGTIVSCTLPGQRGCSLPNSIVPVKQAAPKSKIRVLLVDDHPIVRRGLQLLLSLEPDLMVCGEADSGPAALEKILALKPDVAIVDLALKSSSGLDLIKQVRAQRSRMKILVFTMRAESIYADRALRAGANGYITKEEGAEKAIEAIRLLMQGKTCFSQPVADAMMARMTGKSLLGASSFESLSDRELEVLELIGNGHGSRAIAQRLNVSIKTIESHREHIKTKLGLKRASELVNYAFNWVNER